MLPEAYICHRIPGRMRIKIPSRRGDSSYFSSLREHLSFLPGVERLEVNPITGSLLFLFKPGEENILDHAARSHLFRIKREGKQPVTVSQKAVQGFDALNDRVKSFTGGELDIASIAFLAFLGLGVYQVYMGNLMAPAWYVAFWYAMNIAQGSAKGIEEA